MHTAHVQCEVCQHRVVNLGKEIRDLDLQVLFRLDVIRDAAVVAFRLVSTSSEKDGTKKVTNYLNSGTFLKRDGKWQVVNWQATAMPKPAEKAP